MNKIEIYKTKNYLFNYLRQNNKRITNERIVISDYALGIDTHFDADELYKKILKDRIKISRATVYNTLELMSKCNILTRHNFRGDRTRYEKKYGRKKHMHILCEDTGDIIEVEIKEIDEIIKNICKSRNVKLQDYTIQIFAKCKKF